MRPIAPLLLVLALGCGEAVAPPTAAPPAASPAEAILPLLDAACAHGFPDLRQATWLVGKVTVASKAAPTRRSSSIRFGKYRSSTSNGITTTTFDGLHAKLPDGRLVLGLTTIPNAADTVTPDGELRPCTTAELPAVAKERSRWAKRLAEMTEAQIEEQLERVPAEHRQRMRDSMQASALMELAGGPAILHFIHAGVPGAERALAMLGGFYADRGNDSFDLDLPNRTSSFSRHVIGAAAHAERTIPSDARVVALSLQRWFEDRIQEAADDRPAWLQHARDFAAATTADAGWVAGLDLLAAREGLPTTATANDPLSLRLIVWEPGHNWDDDDDNDNGPSEEMLARMPAEHRAHMQEQIDQRKRQKLVGPADFDGLFAELDNTKPSRWLHNDRTVRTIGDNALRALGCLMRVDPRILAQRDPAAPWTAAERTATATALRAWHAPYQGKPLAQILAAEIVRLPVDASASLLASWKPEDRTPALDRLATAWAGKPMPEAEAESIARLLAAAQGHAGIATLAATWTGTDDHALVLATWKQMQGDSTALDPLVEAALTAKAPDKSGANAFSDNQAISNPLAIACRFPTPARLTRFLEVVTQDGPAAEALAQLALNDNTWSNPAQPLIEPEGRQGRRNDDDAPKPQMALRLALCLALLADTRPLPEGVVTLDDDGDVRIKTGLHHFSSHGGNAKPANGAKLAADLRRCDLAAWTIANQGYSLDLDYRRLQRLKMDLTKPIAERDDAVNRAREMLVDPAADALKAAGLPETLPGAKPAAAPDALF